MTTFKDNVLDTIVYTYYSENFSAKLAYEKLQKLTGAESYTLQDVEKLYKKIDEKVFSLRKPDKVNLVDLPWHFNKEVVRYLDIQSRMSLRKTCSLFRHLVNIERLRIDTLEIGLSLRYIRVTIDQALEIHYWKSKDKNCCEVHCDDLICDVENTFKIEAFRDLATILNHPKLEIGEMIVRKAFTDVSISDYNLPFNTIPSFHRFMNSLENRPKVECLQVRSHSSDFLLYPILRNLDETFIKEIQIHEIIPSGLPQFTKYEIFELPQWKNATCVIGNNLNLNTDKWLEFMDFNYCEARFMFTNGLTLQKFQLWKDKLLQNPQLDQVKIRTGSSLKLSIIKKFNESLGILGVGYNDVDPVWAEIPYPGSEKKLSICVARDLIWFKGPEYEEPEESNVEDEEGDEETDTEEDSSSDEEPN